MPATLKVNHIFDSGCPSARVKDDKDSSSFLMIALSSAWATWLGLGLAPMSSIYGLNGPRRASPHRSLNSFCKVLQSGSALSGSGSRSRPFLQAVSRKNCARTKALKTGVESSWFESSVGLVFRLLTAFTTSMNDLFNGRSGNSSCN